MKKILSVLLILLFFISVFPSASAEGILTALDNSNVSAVSEDAWNQYIRFLFDFDNIDPDNVGIGYYNFSTGEEYYHNGDKYYIAASLYKVPLNMIFAEKVYNGEMDMDTEIGGIKYDEIQYSTIVDSNNEKCEILWNSLGDYMGYKRISAKYLSDDPDNMPWEYYINNNFTAKQFIHCLKELENNKEKYPGVIDRMLLAGPGVHFKRDVSWCDIASKMGYVTEEGYHTVYNDMGIVYTNDTFAIVMMTDNVPDGVGALADYCTLMCDYTNTRFYDRQSKNALYDRIENIFLDFNNLLPKKFLT